MKSPVGSSTHGVVYNGFEETLRVERGLWHTYLLVYFENELAVSCLLRIWFCEAWVVMLRSYGETEGLVTSLGKWGRAGGDDAEAGRVDSWIKNDLVRARLPKMRKYHGAAGPRWSWDVSSASLHAAVGEYLPQVAMTWNEDAVITSNLHWMCCRGDYS